MHIRGTVRDEHGNTISGVIVYAYHTNASGLYPLNDDFKGRSAYRHGQLRGWAISDDQGKFGFDTIRPAGYPDSDLPAHVHMHVIEVGRCTYYIDDIMFDDDPRLTRQQRQRFSFGRGGSGFVSPTRDQSGIWMVTRDIVLGEKIPGYPKRAEQGDPPKSPSESNDSANAIKLTPEQKNLSFFVGTWELSVEGVEKKGHAEIQPILGGRFITEDVKLPFGDFDMEWHGVIGHNEGKKQYSGIWFDNADNTTHSSSGEADESGRVITFRGEQVGIGKFIW